MGTNIAKSANEGRRPYLKEELNQGRVFKEKSKEQWEGQIDKALGPSLASPEKLPFLSILYMGFHGRFCLKKRFQSD